MGESLDVYENVKKVQENGNILKRQKKVWEVLKIM